MRRIRGRVFAGMGHGRGGMAPGVAAGAPTRPGAAAACPPVQPEKDAGP
jgi:hypothetical protein